MSDTLEDRNARAIVGTWRQGDHRQAWGPLRSDCPSEVVLAAAVEWGELAKARLGSRPTPSRGEPR